MIKKLFFLFSVSVLIVFLFSGCSKTTTTVAGCKYTNFDTIAPAVQTAYIQSYLTANGLTAIQHPSGLFYKINSTGTGATPTVCSSVIVKYTGWLMPSGFKFAEENGNAFFTLGGTIYGWQKSLPLIMPGGNITIYVPPALAYGANATGSIPANSYLIFGIQLTAVQ